MSISENFFFFIGIIFTLFGLVFTAGVVGNIVDSENERSFAEWLIWLFIFGIVPISGGVLLCRRMSARGNNRKAESYERKILQLASQNAGRLSVGDVAMKTELSTSEAKRHLDQFHQQGLADISVSDLGVVIYQFRYESGEAE